MIPTNDAIAAISTPPGTSGIGIVRISGKDAPDIAARIFRPNGKKQIAHMPGYTSLLGRIYDGEEPVDDAICQIFREPRSYTGENVVELSCHGGMWILRKVLRLCLQNGARAAGPGEFTKRAFLNGKLGLTEAEAVMDMISAQGQSAMKAAISARDGAVSSRVRLISETLIGQSAHLAAWADFPDEDLEELDINALAGALDRCASEISALLSTYDAGRIMREGVLTVIAGKPNVGKSTLMNLLAGEERSIVTDIPGTTRDVIEDSVRLGDFVLRLSDTAGIRETADPVEIAGVERSRSRMRAAELIFAVFDSSDTLGGDDASLLEELADKPCIAIINKIDLPQRLDVSAIEARVRRVVTISAKTGEGVGELKQAVSDILGLVPIDPAAGIVANERQRACLLGALEDVREAKTALSANMLDAVNVCVDSAIDELLTLTGERASERVIDEVFSRFCVGK